MHIPDRVIVRKLREYDPYLYVTWNTQEQYFELWREMVHGRRLITPVTQSIYDPKKPISFCALDERLLNWVVEADSWRSGGHRAHALAYDKRFKEIKALARKKKKEFFYEASKDAYRAINNFYVTKASAFKNEAKTKTWVKPDSVGITSQHVVARSRANALKYNFKRR